MVLDVNDPKETNPFVDELFALAIHSKCPLVCVIHENHGSIDGKTRGHLGSQLMRKAATNLQLEKDKENGVIQVWGERMRRGHISKGEGPKFIWDEETGMHVTFEGPIARPKSLRRRELWELAEPLLLSRGALRHSDLVSAIMPIQKCSDRTAKTRIKEMAEIGVLLYHSDSRSYSLNKSFTVELPL
jgi:hypothetical protein